MRLSSVTLPSCIGTLKSTRIRTRLPFRSISFTVFLFMRCSAHIGKQENRYTSPLPVYLSTFVLSQTLHNHCCQVSGAAGIAPFIVVPRYNLDHVADHKRIQGAEHRGVIRAAQVGRDQWFVGYA